MHSPTLATDGTLTVGLEHRDRQERAAEYRRAVRLACAFWSCHSETYTDTPVSLELADSSHDGEPDVLVRVVDDLEGEPGHVTADAPDPSVDAPVSRPAHIRVRTGFTVTGLVLLLVHELGHVLGLEHGDEPEEVMALVKHHSLTAHRRAEP